MPKPRPLHARLWEKVEVRGGDECWPWTGATRRKGYGSIGTGGRSGQNGARPMNAHRAAWLVTFGPIPDGMWVLHHCDNRVCCRPDHLFLGTPAENTADMMVKGRERRGYPIAVRDAVLAAYADGEAQHHLAERFGVTRRTVGRWVHGHFHHSTTSSPYPGG